MIKTKKRSIASLTTDEHQAMIELLRPHYIDPLPQFTNSLQINDTVYITKFKDQIPAYFMVKWGELAPRENLVYCGISCVKSKLKNAHLGPSLDGSYSPYAADKINKIKKEAGLEKYSTPEHPLKLFTNDVIQK